ncbi:VanZ family protein [Anaerolentibacter hominis]|uniref:VanZ family protein n=1 Tax=Anaerolentibacter hominis TaxID=3079009 RepID=UPI0031B84A79
MFLLSYLDGFGNYCMRILPVVLIFQILFLIAGKARRHGFHPLHEIGILVYSATAIAVFNATGISPLSGFTPYIQGPINLVPFTDITNGGFIANIVLFIPLGFLLPLFWQSCRKFYKTLILGAFVSAAIEIWQMFLIRVTDIDDFFANSAGVLLGYLLFASLRLICPGLLAQFTGSDDQKGTGILKLEPLFYIVLPFAAILLIGFYQRSFF